jgi:hypothetical protein
MASTGWSPFTSTRMRHHRDEQVENDLVRNQVAALLVTGHFAADGRARVGLGPQHISGGDVLNRIERGQLLALRALAAAGSGEQQ